MSSLKNCSDRMERLLMPGRRLALLTVLEEAYSSRRGKKDDQGTVDLSASLRFLERSCSMFPWSPFPSP